VLGTAELIRLALTSRIKRFDYVSTFGVPQMHPGLVRAPESIDIRQGAPDMPLGDGYAQGYGASKWASEVLLREANEHFGLPVTVYRPDMIMPHSRHRGQINVPDMLTRLLFSLIMSGVAPESFYEREADGGIARVHYDGLPVDFLAHAILQLGSQHYGAFRTFNTISAHVDDGVSLDTISGWIESAGYPLQRVVHHAEWLRRFTERLRNLSDEQRQHSSLNLLAYVERPQPVHGVKVRNEEFVGAVGEVPQLSEAYIHKYLDDMRQLGLLPQALISDR
jgi:fatty acid CoA ligase FadD9